MEAKLKKITGLEDVHLNVQFGNEDIKSILRRHQSKAGALSKSVRAMTAKTVAACSKDLAELGLAAMANIYGGEYGEGETEATVIKTVLPGVSKSSL